jgi:hypothetical protein
VNAHAQKGILVNILCSECGGHVSLATFKWVWVILFYFMFFWLRGVLELVLGSYKNFHEIGRPRKFRTKIWKTLQE